MARTVDIALLPAEAASIEADCFIAVDVLRATTTIAALFSAGLRDLVVMSDIAAARLRAKEEGALLVGEEHGLRPEGFDYGNSPVEAWAAPVSGRRAVHLTTNGTASLCQLAGRGQVITGALSNLAAVAAYASRFDRVLVVCAGNAHGARFSLEDFAAAGAICAEILLHDHERTAGDAAQLARGRDYGALVAGSEHAAYLRSIGLGADIAFAVQRNTSNAVPLVVESGDGWALLNDDARASAR